MWQGWLLLPAGKVLVSSPSTELTGCREDSWTLGSPVSPGVACPQVQEGSWDGTPWAPRPLSFPFAPSLALPPFGGDAPFISCCLFLVPVLTSADFCCPWSVTCSCVPPFLLLYLPPSLLASFHLFSHGSVASLHLPGVFYLPLCSWFLSPTPGSPLPHHGCLSPSVEASPLTMRHDFSLSPLDPAYIKAFSFSFDPLGLSSPRCPGMSHLA